MKKLYITILIFIIIIMLTACSAKVNQAKTSDLKLKVYTSFYTMYDFTNKIGKDKADTVNMVPSGTEPHDYEPKPQDISNLEKAGMFVYNGAGLEHWVDGVMTSINNANLKQINASNGVELISEGGESDPHVWLSPKNAKIELENIKNGFTEKDPQNKDYYEENYKFYADKLDKLDEEFKSTIESLPKKDIVVAHKAYSYMCKEYGLNQIAIDGLSPDSEPDSLRMAQIIDVCKLKNIKVIFTEELVSPKIAENIAQSTGAKVLVLNPLEGLSQEEIEKGEDYFSVMHKNLESLKEALS